MARPKPSAEFLDLTGGTPRDRSAAAKPSEHVGGKPPCPSYLSPEARKEWRRCVKILLERGQLTRGDGPCLEQYVQTYVRWRAALKEIEDHGLFVTVTRSSPSGKTWEIRVENPASKTASTLENSLRQMQKELSLTPASRDKARKVAAGRDAKNIIPGSVADLEQKMNAGDFAPEEQEQDDAVEKVDSNEDAD